MYYMYMNLSYCYSKMCFSTLQNGRSPVCLLLCRKGQGTYNRYSFTHAEILILLKGRGHWYRLGFVLKVCRVTGKISLLHKYMP